MQLNADLTLFSSITIGAIKAANRIAMAPLARSRAGMDGVQTPLAVDYYRQRASAKAKDDVVGALVESGNVSGVSSTPRQERSCPIELSSAQVPRSTFTSTLSAQPSTEYGLIRQTIYLT